MFVDDEPELVRLAARVLEEAGYAVVTASSGEEALRVLEASAGAVDLLVTDAVMPGMAGADLAATVHQSFPQLPVLFMSGYLDAAGHERLRLPDGAAVLEKPYPVEELLARVRRALDAPGPADAWRGGRRRTGQGSKR